MLEAAHEVLSVMLLELAVAPNKLMVVTVLDHVIPRVSQQVTHKRPIGADRYQFLLHPNSAS